MKIVPCCMGEAAMNNCTCPKPNTPAAAVKRLASRVLRLAEQHARYEESWKRKTAGLSIPRKTWMRLVSDARKVLKEVL